MKITTETSLTDFKFWSEAEKHSFSYQELKELDVIISDIYQETNITETEVNDLFWFEEEVLCEWLNIDFNEYLNR
jgi:hypothetical protein